ncbi:MAG TPA: cation:proton antiporter [Propionibacteriaceae bacterium]|nr:cation:proton antiporter [Propionibacteriaceae bacterium]
MDSTAGSLFLIALCAAVAPLLARVVPRRLVPEVVLLLLLGMLVGPQVWGVAEVTGGVEVLRELGLGMLFLLAGYEVKVSELTGSGGRRALLTWLICLALAVAVVLFLDRLVDVGLQVAVGIALTSTALGTLLPLLKDEGLVDTQVGATVLRHGAVGELGPSWPWPHSSAAEAHSARSWSSESSLWSRWL